MNAPNWKICEVASAFTVSTTTEDADDHAVETASRVHKEGHWGDKLCVPDLG